MTLLEILKDIPERIKRSLKKRKLKNERNKLKKNKRELSKQISQEKRAKSKLEKELQKQIKISNSGRSVGDNDSLIQQLNKQIELKEQSIIKLEKSKEKVIYSLDQNRLESRSLKAGELIGKGTRLLEKGNRMISGDLKKFKVAQNKSNRKRAGIKKRESQSVRKRKSLKMS